VVAGQSNYKQADRDRLILKHVQHVLRVKYVCRAGGDVATKKDDQKQNVTISLDRKIIQKARIVAARRSTSISGLLARQVEILGGEEEAYERAERQATTLLDQGFHWGGVIRVGRDDLHER
jgi:hypothetical protein